MLRTTALATHDVDHVGSCFPCSFSYCIYFEEKLGTTSTRFCVELRAISMKMTPNSTTQDHVEFVPGGPYDYYSSRMSYISGH